MLYDNFWVKSTALVLILSSLNREIFWALISKLFIISPFLATISLSLPLVLFTFKCAVIIVN